MEYTLKNKLKPYFIDHVFRQGIGKLLPDKQFIYFDYLFVFGSIPNLQHPATFSEKIQWIKIYGHLEQYSRYVDKLKVRKYITKTIGSKYLIPLAGSWKNVEEINFKNLPRQFVMKATHGSSYVFVCKDKATLDIQKLKRTINNWLTDDFYIKTREIQYKFCTPLILCEKYMEDASGGLTDYKIYCFNGKPRMIQVHSDRFIDNKITFMDLQWHSLPITVAGSPTMHTKLHKPEHLNRMLKMATELSKPFPFVRVDLYSVSTAIYFGELTFTPANGLNKFNPPDADYQLGKFLNIASFTNSTVKLYE